MVALHEITMGSARLVLAPELGGSIARLDVDDVPLLRPWKGNDYDLFSLACNILVPFSNRISNGGFYWNGQWFDVPNNLKGESFAIHGDGFQKAWALTKQGPMTEMHLADGGHGPWKYSASQAFNLSERSLHISLAVTNTAEYTLPFGCGFHPWFPRSAQTKLSFTAGGMWTENEKHLPESWLNLEVAPEWGFAQPRVLSEGVIDNCYTGWHGQAYIAQGSNAISFRITASDNLNTAHVYSPNNKADFFCFEPVSHPVDSFNLDGQPGLVALAHGETLQSSMTIDWSADSPKS